VLAHKHSAKVLLGSATPSVESRYHAETGKYGFVELTERFGEATLPSIELINLKQATEAKAMNGVYAKQMLQAIAQNMEAGNQTIVFQNRRGFAPWIECANCNWTAMCYRCDVGLTYHYKNAILSCHYCGHSEAIPKTCPNCGAGNIDNRGFGTEKVEDDMAIIFPKALIARMDLDTTRSKAAFANLIDLVENGGVDLLVGTQMISKGLDFERVSLVCILDCDRLIHYPDFRAHERTFQLLTQVSGRAGRRGQQGKVLIQTNNPDHPLLQQIVLGDYHAMYTQEKENREAKMYPPFGRLIQFTLKHQDQAICYAAALQLANYLNTQLAERVHGPDKPGVERIRDRYLYEILLKFERNAKLEAIKKYITDQMNNIWALKEYKAVQIIVDVDYTG
jgi:primosomal protein N' (replication factor Y) (superfamily II helicase)